MPAMHNREIIFGPVPSRRLGQSLGINNVPFKTCSYSCVYCQVGRTEKTSVYRKEIYRPSIIIEATGRALTKLKQHGEKVDFISFVPDGEPTIDIHLGETLRGLAVFGIKTAVFSNSSLTGMTDVRADLMQAGLVSLKIDSVSEEEWQKINRPCESLNYNDILRGIRKFADEFGGTLFTETMIVKGLNDSPESTSDTAEFIKKLRPAKAFLGVAARPPAESWVEPPEENVVQKAYISFINAGINAEMARGGNNTGFGFTGDVKQDILNIVSVHPMSRRQIVELLKKAGAEHGILEKLLKEGMIKEIIYNGQTYYLKQFKR